MDFRELETFITVVDKGSISAAATFLGLSQPAISKRIAKMEETMGTKLFATGHKHSTLTQEGKILYKYALKIQDIRDKVKSQISDMSQEITGSINISASSIPGDYILPEMLVEFLQIHRGVNVKVHSRDSHTALEELFSKKIDLAVVGSDRVPPGYNSIPFVKDQFVLIVGDNHPMANRNSVSIPDAMALNLVGRIPGSGTKHTFEKYLKNTGVPARDANLQFGHVAGLVNAVIGGAEGAIVSSLAVKNCAKIKAIPFNPQIHRQFYLVYGSCDSKAMEVLLDFLKGKIK